MMYKDLEEEKLPTAHDTFIKHFNFDKSGWVETQDQCIINAMEEYALIKIKKLRDENASLEQQLEERNISIQAIEYFQKTLKEIQNKMNPCSDVYKICDYALNQIK